MTRSSVLSTMQLLLPSFATQSWVQRKDGDPWGRALYQRHYSRHAYKDGRDPKLYCGPGEKIVLTLQEGCGVRALFVWRKFRSMDDQTGINCAVFRNESRHLSSRLILDAEEWAVERWPGERFYTYVNARKINSKNPGYCFKCAGWSVCGKTKSGLLILEKFQK